MVRVQSTDLEAAPRYGLDRGLISDNQRDLAYECSYYEVVLEPSVGSGVSPRKLVRVIVTDCNS